MHPTLEYEIIRARLADQQRHTDQAAIAHAARRGRVLAPRPPTLLGWQPVFWPCSPAAAGRCQAGR